MEDTMLSEAEAKRCRGQRHRGMDLERICRVLCKYAERFEAEDAESEQISPPDQAVDSTVQAIAPASDRRSMLQKGDTFSIASMQMKPSNVCW